MPLLDVPADDRAFQVVAAALVADAALSPADTLYEHDAVVVADGRVRRDPPYYAAIGTEVERGGAVAITASRIELRAGLAIVHVAYRWVATQAAVVREGVATFVIGPDAQGRWRIRHAHSSESRPPSAQALNPPG
jgi:hypothetical protein